MNTPHTNRVIIVGRLDTLRRQGQDRAAVASRNGMGGAFTEFAVQTVTAFGLPVSLHLLAPGSATGLDLLQAARVGQPLVVEGELRRSHYYDSRYAIGQDDPGLPVRETTITVMGVRDPRADEPHDMTAVWLEGTVRNLPHVTASQANRAVHIATLLLQIATTRPSAYPGSRALLHESMDINIAVPTALPDAAALYRPGNQVRLEGQIDCALVPMSGDKVDQKLAQIDAEWASTREMLAGRTSREQLGALREHRRQRDRLRLTRRISVLASYVELIDGHPRPLEEAVAQRTRNRARAPRQEASGRM